MFGACVNPTPTQRICAHSSTGAQAYSGSPSPPQLRTFHATPRAPTMQRAAIGTCASRSATVHACGYGSRLLAAHPHWPMAAAGRSCATSPLHCHLTISLVYPSPTLCAVKLSQQAHVRGLHLQPRF
ncbi:hypothetical protein NX059_011298 [Plenodomus lindquistii]|nr:hypothetical protein NX059_011298 [Plenodomus lindquistii]